MPSDAVPGMLLRQLSRNNRHDVMTICNVFSLRSNSFLTGIVDYCEIIAVSVSTFQVSLQFSIVFDFQHKDLST